MNDKELIKMLEEECEALRQQLRDCHLYMTDTQKWKMARDNANIQYDIRVERCD
jgi:hypothetical protein